MSDNNYKGVKIALHDFIVARVGIPDAQVYRAPPLPTEIMQYPIAILRSATSQKVTIGEYGVGKNRYSLLVAFMTRATVSQTASDELDDFLQVFDNAIATYGARDLNSAYGQWHLMTRLDQATTFDNPIQDDVGWITYGATAGVLIEEKLSQDEG